MRRWLGVWIVLSVLMLETQAMMAQQTKKSDVSPAQKSAPASKAEASATSTVSKPAPQASVPAVKLTPAQPAADTLLRYLPDDVFVVAGIQPSKLINATTLTDAVKAAKGEDVVAELLGEATKEMGLDPSKVLEAAVYIDRKTLEESREAGKQAAARRLRHNNLKQIGLSMHNFHDVYNRFPDDDGIDDSKGNLSWRVHLLPFLEQSELYEEFRLSEPWDSEHNKSLIEKMPDVFKVDGIKEPGKTSIHVLTGEGTPFGGDEAPGIRDVIDGTSNTIMTVEAGIDTADFWTKPGGLEIDVKEPLKALGTLDKQFNVLLMDGSVRELKTSIDSTAFLHLAQHQDAEYSPLDYEPQGSRMPIPGVIVRYAEKVDSEGVVTRLLGGREGETLKIGGMKATQFEPDGCVMFPDPQTILISNESGLRLMMAERGESMELKKRFGELFPQNDGVIVASLEFTDEEIQSLFQGAPFIGFIQQLVGAEIVVNATGDAESLLSIEIETDDEAAAQQISGIVNGGFQITKGQLLNEMSQERSGIPEDVVTVISDLFDSVVIESNESTVTLDVPKIEDPEKLLKDLNPTLTELFDGMRTGMARSKEYQKLNSIKQMGLALHNYHDVYNGFPSWNTPRGDGENKELSWRVHLLPYLEHADLYAEFHLDEPWDSEHNKTLIEKMPDVFKSAGVEEAGKTSFHMFLGEKTPFGGDEPLKLHHITDGTSNTLMIVQAGPDKAEIWTKPSGLEYDPEAPKECLGAIGEQLMILLCDGSARFIRGDIEDETLLRLIEHADGRVIGDF